MAYLRPSRASEMTSLPPFRPCPTRPRRNSLGHGDDPAVLALGDDAQSRPVGPSWLREGEPGMKQDRNPSSTARLRCRGTFPTHLHLAP